MLQCCREGDNQCQNFINIGKGQCGGFVKNIVVVALAAIGVNEETLDTCLAEMIVVAIGGSAPAPYLW